MRVRAVLIVDDHELVRLGLRAALSSHFGPQLELHEAETLEHALAWLRAHVDEPVLVLLDLQLDDTRGLSGLHLLRQHHPRLPVIVVSGVRDERVRDEALVNGASDYICKGGADRGLPELIQAVEKATTQAPPARMPTRHAGRLGKRQVQVLDLILAGHDNQAIVSETGLTLGSVKNCVSSIFLVFNVRSRAELIGLFAS